MEKKEYKKPAAKVYQIKPAQVICASASYAESYFNDGTTYDNGVFDR